MPISLKEDQDNTPRTAFALMIIICLLASALMNYCHSRKEKIVTQDGSLVEKPNTAISPTTHPTKEKVKQWLKKFHTNS